MDREARDRLADGVLRALERAVPGSTAALRGSLAAGTADPYSDIDVLWIVPDDRFGDAVETVAAALSVVAPLESLRFDPEFQRSDRRRLVFARFEGVPLFWRLDLDIRARSIAHDEAYDRENPYARGSDWSRTESALMNVVAAIKAHHRQDDATAMQLLRRGYERVGIRPQRERLQDRLRELTEGIAALDPAMQPLAQCIFPLIGEAFPP
jgi:predicted nucleotidyltransferase